MKFNFQETMEKRTIAQAAIEVLTQAQKPLTASEITQSITDQNLYSFNTKDPRGMVRGAIERRCEGMKRKDSIQPKYFKRIADGKYELTNYS
ncbi:MAG: winged helix-turn-helix domain-containing protein [Microcoleaceae cyanobacterium]